MNYHLPPIFRGPEADVLPLAGEVNWGMEVFGIEFLRSITKGKGFKIGGVDTGVDPDHPLMGNLKKAKDETGSSIGFRDRNGHGCVAPWDKLYTSLCGLQTSEYLFNNAPGIAYFEDTKGTIVKDVSRYEVKTISVNPKTGVPVESKILAVHKLQYSGDIYKIETTDGELSLTPWHPVYVVSSRRGNDLTIVKKRADKVSYQDKILLPSAGPSIGKLVSVPYGYVWAGDEEPTRKYKTLDCDLAYLAGLVASDGHVNKSTKTTVDFCNADAELGREFSKLCVKLFGVEPKKYNYGNLASTWRLNCKDAYDILINIGIPCGNKSSTIEFPNLITKSPREVILAFVAGLLEGDGNVKERIRLATGSKTFADDLSLMLKTLGINSSVSEVKPSKSDRPSYCVRIGADKGILDKIRVKSVASCKEPYRKKTSAVLRVRKEKYSGPMYDLTVEGTHNYVANGHIVSNTHISGTIAATDPRIGVMTECDYYHGKGLSDSGSGSMSDLLRAIEFCLSEGCKIVSNSWGGGTTVDSGTDRQFREWAESGIWLIFAAGNSGGNTQVTDAPGNSPHVINIAALNQNLTPASFTSAGDKIDTSGPGVNIWSCRPGGGFAQMSGSSMATPFDAGVFGLLYHALQLAKRPIPDVYELRKVLFSRSTDTHLPGDDRRTGPGWLSPVLLRSYLTPDPE